MVFKPIQPELPEIKKIKKKTSQSSFVNGRWAIVVLFFLTVAASLFFYFQAEAPRLWQKITSPVVVSTLPGKFNPQPVLDQIEALTENRRGTYGVYVYRFDGQLEYGVHQDEVFPAASLIKLPVMLTLYQEAEKGKLSLVDYRVLAEAMGKRSDNAAFRRLVKVLGAQKIQKTIDDLGMTKTSLEKNDTTPKDIGLFFRKLYQESLVTDEHREEIFSFLTETEFEDRIPAGIPSGVRVIHKIGTEIGSFSDAGIIESANPFVLVIISKNAREAEAQEVLPQIAKKVWEFESR